MANIARAGSMRVTAGWAKIAASLLSLLMLAGCASAPERRSGRTGPPPPSTSGTKDALYRELGGKEGITKVVDLFLAKVDDDLRINLFFEKTEHKDLRNLVIDQFCQATGGPCVYSGRSMEEAHSGLNLADADFDAFAEDLIAAMGELEVAKTSQDKLLALLGPMKPQVVGQ